jgi:hypothetical protein
MRPDKGVIPRSAIQSQEEKEMSMLSKAKPTKGKDLHAISSQVAATKQASIANGVRTGEIRRRAHEIYLERGEQPGRDLDDWLQAEWELENGVLSLSQAR